MPAFLDTESLELFMQANHVLYTAQQVRDLDRIAIETFNIPGIVLMKRAGKVAFKSLLELWPKVNNLHIICGGGNNGGDGYIVAAIAAQKRISTTVWQVSSELKGDAARAADYALQEGVVIQPYSEQPFRDALENDKEGVIVDALLGTGFSGALKPQYSSIIRQINTSNMPVLAIDIPSGVDASTGQVNTLAVNAQATVSFIGQKVGNFISPGRIHCGQQLFDDLGVPSEVYVLLKTPPRAQILSLKAGLEPLPSRQMDAHKGSHGHVLIIGGDIGFGGAPLMAAEMSTRSGAGLVGVATQADNVSAILARRPEVMAKAIDNGQNLLAQLGKPDVLVVGPGLGQTAWSEQMLYQCLETDKAMVLDADALNLISQGRIALPKSQQRISTPHPGEAARLLGVSIEEIQNDRIAAVTKLQEKLGGAVILKGAGTLVMTADQSLFVCDAGNPGMASGGMGDVLSGLLGSLIAQGMSVDTAACLGVLVHSMAADLAAEDEGTRGLLATDLIDYVRLLLNND
jgi:NAD(P)H-hydrate epimerase